MARQWVVNNTSGTRQINGVMLAPGEGTWVDDSPAPSGPTPTPQLRAALSSTQVSALAAAGYPVASGTLLVDPATGQVYGQSDGVGGYTPLGGGLTAGGITGLPAVDAALPLIVPGVQGAAMGQATFRPSSIFADWPTLLATPSPQAWDRHLLIPGVLSNMRPIEVVHNGQRFVPLGVCDWNYTSLHDSDANIVRRTTAGAFALAVALGGSTLLVPTPANCLRVGSHCEGELIIRRTGTNAASTVPAQLRFGKTPSLIIGTDNIAVNNAGEGRFIWSFGITGPTTIYTSAFSGIGASQTLPNEVSSADIDLASIMGLGVYLNGADGDNTFAVQSLRVKWFI